MLQNESNWWQRHVVTPPSMLGCQPDGQAAQALSAHAARMKSATSRSPAAA